MNIIQFRESFYSHRAAIFSILLILIAGLISISWFQGSFLINGIDRSFPPNRTVFFIRGFYMWDIFQLGGESARTTAGLFPANLFLFISEVAGLSIVTAEKLWFYLLFSASGLSMYFLTITVTGGKYRHLVGLVSALFYMFNPFTIIVVVPQMWLYIIFLPLILGMFIKGIKEKHGLKYILIMSLIWTLTTSSDYVNPKYLLFDFAPLLLFLLVYFMFNRNMPEIKRSVRFAGLLLIVFCTLNAFWILPTLSTLKSLLASPLSAYAVIGTSRLSNYAQASAPLSGSFRLLGFWSLNADYKGFPYAYWAPVYNSPLFITIGILIPILAFAFLLRKPTTHNRFFFAILAVIGLFMMNGSSPPLGWINEYVISNLPFALDVFSNPYMFGGMYVALSFAFLFGSFMSDLLSSKWLITKVSSFLKGHLIKYVLAGLILFLVIGLYAFPLWNGDVIYPGNAIMASNRYSIPSYYYDAKSWLSTDASDFRLFSLPYSILGYGAFNWLPAGFNGPDPTEPLLGRSVIAGLSGQGLGLEAARDLVNGSNYNLAKFLALMNVKYVLVHNDANWAYLNGNSWYVSPTPEKIPSILNNQTGFLLVKTFGQLDFYKNDFWQPSRVYYATNSILSDENLDELITLAQRNDFTPNDSVIMLSSELDAKQTSTFPINTQIIQNPDFNSSYNLLSTVSNQGRIVYMIESKPVAVARYYSGWKGVISTNGQGDGSMLVFNSPTQCPYLNAFPMSFTNWSSYDSTLIYVSSLSPLKINSVFADGGLVSSEAWWQTGTSWTTGWPVTIPPNQNVLIQVGQKASSITLETDNGSITVPVTDGWKDPITIEGPSKSPPKVTVPIAGDYLMAIKAAEFGYGSLSVKIDNQLFSVDLNSQEQGSVYKYIGPINLTAGSHTISASKGNLSISELNGILLYSLKNGESFLNTDNLLSSNQQNNATITYEEIDPTRYTVHVNSSQPFYLVFSESYDNGWVATINGQQIPNQYHFTANGYANGWYINKTGTYTITLEFTPQNLFYAGAAVSITTLIISTFYVSKNRIKNIYQKHVKKNKVSN